MSDYFRNIRNVHYSFDKAKDNLGNPIDQIHKKLVTDITMRTKLKKTVKQDLVTYYPYIVKDGQRPDNIANEYYGSTDYTWIVFLSNNIFDPIFEWPMSKECLRKFIITKYGSLDDAISTVHHYEEIIQPFTDSTPDHPEILERTIEIDESQYRRLIQLGTNTEKVITNYEYEFNLNRNKSFIQLIEDVYVQDIMNNARKLFEEMNV